MLRGFPSHKNTEFHTPLPSIFTFPQGEKTSVGIREPSTGHEREGIAQGEEDVLISGYDLN